MFSETYWRAKTIVDRREIIFDKDESSPPDIYSFKVKQRSGEWSDVRRKKIRGVTRWSCDAISAKKDGKEWYCGFNVHDPSKPFCSHTFAALLLLRRYGRE